MKLRDIVPQNVKDIINTLQQNKHEALLCGGCVRDFELNKLPKDFDICTSASVEQIAKLFPKSATCGNNFLVSMVGEVEVATFRKDKADHAEMTSSSEEDALRRDFTVNALFYDIKTDQTVDWTGFGLHDLTDRVLRFVGNPSERIQEDSTRILRGIRFSAQLNLEIEKDTYFAMLTHKHLLADIPKERIQQEVIKAFSGTNTYRFVTLLREMEILEYIFPCWSVLDGIDGGKYHNEHVSSHCMYALKAVDDTKNYRLKLASFYHDIGKHEWDYNSDNEIIFKGHNQRGLEFVKYDLGKHLKMSNKDVEYVMTMCSLHMHHIDSPKTIRRLYVKLLEAGISMKEFILLRFADDKGNIKGDRKFIDYWRMYKECLMVLNHKQPFSVKSLAINGKDIMDEFDLPQCKRIGTLLSHAFEGVLNEVVVNERLELLEYLTDEMGNYNV